MSPKPTPGPMVLRSNCPVHGLVAFEKRCDHDWAWWCPRHGEGEWQDDGGMWQPGATGCYYLIWIRDFLENPDGGDPRAYWDVWAEISGEASWHMQQMADAWHKARAAL